MKDFIDGLYIRGMNRALRFKDEIWYNENGDTNFISIIIILGIVLALVVVFRGYIQGILDKIKDGVNGFNNDAFKG